MQLGTSKLSDESFDKTIFLLDLDYKIIKGFD